LEAGIKSKGADALMLANYGLSKALGGDKETGEKLFDAAAFYGESNHVRGVVLFNRALAAFWSGEVGPGDGYLDQAVRLARREVRRYCGFSVLVKELKQRSPEIATAFARRNL
jgi:hypothetical protein